MKRQVLICVETNVRSNTDYVYITCTLNHFCENSREIKYRPIYLESKTKYRDKKKQAEIKKWKRAYPGDTTVIYFIDMDECHVKPEDNKLLDDIKAFCSQEMYELVLFNRDIEDVYWNYQVPKTEKIEKADQFKAKNLIANIPADTLSSITIPHHKSNILRILDKYWIRKV